MPRDETVYWRHTSPTDVYDCITGPETKQFTGDIHQLLMYMTVLQAQRPNSMWLNKKETQAKPMSPDATTHKSDQADSSRLSKYALKQEKKRLKKDAKVSYNP